MLLILYNLKLFCLLFLINQPYNVFQKYKTPLTLNLFIFHISTSKWKKSYFSVPICSAPFASYHFRSLTFSSTIPIFTIEHPILAASPKACPRSFFPIFLCLYSSNTHKLFSSHSFSLYINRE